MKTRAKMMAVLSAACAAAVAFPQPTAAITDDEFNALKRMVQQLGEKVQKLEQGHEQDEKTHEQDQQQIQQLKQQANANYLTAN